MSANLLKGKIVTKGKKMSEIYGDFEMSKSSFYRKMLNFSEFKVKDIKKIKEVLELSEEEVNEIFFS